MTEFGVDSFRTTQNKMDEIVALVCEAFAAGFLKPPIKNDVVQQWISVELPSRQYASAYAPRPPLRFTQDVEKSGVAKDATDTNDTKKQVKFFDLVQNIASGEASTSLNVSANGTKTVVTTDIGIESVEQLQQDCRHSAPLASELMAIHLFGSNPPKRTIIDMFCRLFHVLLLEPIRIEIDMQFFRPVTSDVDTQILDYAANSTTATAEENLNADRLMQQYLASFTVNWFADVTVLAVNYRHLSEDMLKICATMLQNHDAFFRPEGVSISAHRVLLRNFRYNAKVAKLFDRGALMSEFCKTYIDSWTSNESLRVRDTILVALDETTALVRDTTSTEAGCKFADPETAQRNIATARQAVMNHQITLVDSVVQEKKPIDVFNDIVAAIRSKY